MTPQGSSVDRGIYERSCILKRLQAREPIYVIRPEGQRAVEQLAKQGEVVFAWGDGRDAGMMVVRKAETGRPPPWSPWPSSWRNDGGLLA